VSILAVSILAAVSVVAAESILAESILAESAAADEPEPLQAAAETAIAKAKNAILNEFFIVCFLSDLIVFQLLIPKTKKGNPLFYKKSRLPFKKLKNLKN
jgi:hypothetical protein